MLAVGLIINVNTSDVGRFNYIELDFVLFVYNSF